MAYRGFQSLCWVIHCLIAKFARDATLMMSSTCNALSSSSSYTMDCLPSTCNAHREGPLGHPGPRGAPKAARGIHGFKNHVAFVSDRIASFRLSEFVVKCLLIVCIMTPPPPPEHNKTKKHANKQTSQQTKKRASTRTNKQTNKANKLTNDLFVPAFQGSSETALVSVMALINVMTFPFTVTASTVHVLALPMNVMKSPLDRPVGYGNVRYSTVWRGTARYGTVWYDQAADRRWVKQGAAVERLIQQWKIMK